MPLGWGRSFLIFIVSEWVFLSFSYNLRLLLSDDLLAAR
jgi:hypothetical protein